MEDNQARRIQVIYFLSRMGRIEHPHLIRVHHFSRKGVHLRDVKRWLSDLRGKDMPDSFAWSYKRRYKTGYVWQDLVDDDLITPISDNEYILKGSEMSSVPFDACPCGEKRASTEKRVPENRHKKMEVSAKTSEIEIDEEISEPFKSETSRMTDDLMKSNASKPEKEENRSEKKSTEKNKPPLMHSAIFSKSKSYASGAREKLRNLLTCGAVDTIDSGMVTIKRINRTSKSPSNVAGLLKTETIGGSQRIFGCAWNKQPHQQSSSSTGVKTSKNTKKEPTNQKMASAGCKPVVEPNCSQCGKTFKPEKLHSHMKSCKGMKNLTKIEGSGAGAAAATMGGPEKTSHRGDQQRHQRKRRPVS
ncbi:hypothetical protein NE237_009126 [Protea cynaroides]|uniref:SOSEKI DIX-like domain-containing protein n=1 Tax=Protea cynaroides TaxID=273540 RepID=A0A9Q0KXR1_9MAGN|nr:hypothetical protein NE237_009126 [Protea cynaroides]